MPTKVERENKYLVDPAISWIDLSKLFENLKEIRRIWQTYLKPTKPGEPSVRVRKTISGLSDDLNIEYHYNKKGFIELGANKETEYKISNDEYEKSLKHCHLDKIEVCKTRFVFNYKNQLFELDIFKGPLKGLVILELEIPSKDTKVTLPSFLKVIKEVTKDKNYSNYNLASKNLRVEIRSNQK